MLGNMKIIALCTSRIYDESCTELIGALNDNIVSRGGRLHVFSTLSDLFFGTSAEEGEAKIFDLMNYSMTDAVIIHEDMLKNEGILTGITEKAQEYGIPVFIIGKEHKNCINFDFDFESGFKTVIRHVVEHHKVRTLHMIAGIKGNEFSERRIGCFKEALAEYGIPVDDSMISYGDFWSIPAEEAIQELIDKNAVPDAVICANDGMAIAVSSYLQKHGYIVPDDVIVTGFDGITEAKYSSPKITTSFCDFKAVAEKVVDAIYDTFDGKITETSFLIEPSLLLSESCGCYKGDIISSGEYLTSLNNRFYRYREEDKQLNRISLMIQNSTELSEISKIIDDQTLMYDMSCIVKEEFINPALNPAKVYSKTTFGDTVYAIYKSASSSEERTSVTEFSVKELIFDFENVMSQYKAPFVFNCLSYINMPFGYVCYSYRGDFNNNFVKTMQITMMLSNALNGFRAARYQRYLREHIEESYRRDPMTGLYNRSGFMKRFPDFKADCNGVITAVLADLDNLKMINDTYGHDEGDVAIRAVAQALENSCPEGSICIRFGGDEMFAVVKGRVNKEIRTKIDAWLDNFNSKSGKPYKVSASVGIYTTDSRDADFEELVRKSDQLMYNEKIAKKIKR